jgi:hypothetical protein
MSDDLGAAAAAEEMRKSIPLKIIEDLGYGSFGDIILEDGDINKIIDNLKDHTGGNKNCTDKQRASTSSSMVAFVSGHGNDLDVATRHTIVEAVLGLEFTFPTLDDAGEDIPNPPKSRAKKLKQPPLPFEITKTSYLDILVPDVYKTKAAFRIAFEKYIEENVYLQMALGEPGPSSPMSMAETPNYLTRSIRGCLDKSICLKGFSSSEVDIFIIANAYSLLYNKGLSAGSPVKTPTDCDLIEFARVIRYILRANFIETWDEKPGDIKEVTDLWKIHYLKLLKATKNNPNRPKVWVLKRINKSSFDRYYQLAPNEGEEPEYRVHVGLDIFDLRDSTGAEVPGVVDFNDWKRKLQAQVNPEQSNVFLDANNLKVSTPELDFKERFFNYVKLRFPTREAEVTKAAQEAVAAGVASADQAAIVARANAAAIQKEIKKNKAIRTAIRGILYSVEEAKLYLSEICLLGFLLDIKMLTLYDPACRPLTHTITDEKGKDIVSTTRSGLVRATVDDVYGVLDTYDTLSSQQRH